MSSKEIITETAPAVTTNNERREFFKKVLFYTSAGVVVQAFARSISWAADELKVIDMTKQKRKDPANEEMVKIASGLSYVSDLSAALKAKKITKTDRQAAAGKIVKAADQVCENCQFFNFKKETPAKATCMLLQKVLVDQKGSCNSWAPKA